MSINFKTQIMFRFLFAGGLFLLILGCLFGVVSASAPNPGHTWSEIGDVAVTVAQGGTGQSSLTANNVILGNGTDAVQLVAPSTSGNVLKSNGSTWVSGTPSGKDIYAGRTASSVTSDHYAYFVGHAGGASSSQTAFAVPVPFAGTLKNLNAYTATALGSNNSLVFTVRTSTGCNDSWSSSALTCTVTGNGSTKSCSDTSNTVTVASGDCIQMYLDATGTGVTGNDSWSVEYDY
jgi:hypothetical protein